MKESSQKNVLKRAAAAGLAILMVASLAACSSGSSETASTTAAAAAEAAAQVSEETEAAADVTETGEQVEKGTLTIIASTDAGGLAPYGVNRTGKQVIRSAIYEPLFWIDEDKNLCPILGKSYEYKGNGVYDVELFDYIYDSAGVNMTASDIVFSIVQYLNGGSNGSLSDYYAIDDYTIELVFANESIGNFEKLVTNLYCVTEESWEASGDEMVENPIGTGLYTCTNFIIGSEYDFAARDNYWQTDPEYSCAKNTLNIDNLILKVINDASTIAIAIENGEADFSVNIGDADRGNFIDDNGNAKDGYTIKEVLNASLIRLCFNCCELSPCQDINLRKAIATCVDNEGVAYSAQANFGHAAKSLMNPGYWDADPSINDMDDYYNYDVDKAKEYLAQSSYNGETLRVLVQPNDNCTTAAVLLQAYAREIGVDMELIEPDNAVFGDYLHSNSGEDYDIVVQGLNSTYGYAWDPLSELDINQYSNGLNLLAIYDEKLQELYDISANISTNSPETTNDLIQYVTEQCYDYALFYYDTYYVGLDRVKDIVVGAGNDECIYNAFIVEQ